MKWLQSRVFWGALMILGGVAFLLQNLGVFQFAGLFWAFLFVLAGAIFLSVFFQARQVHWWALIPGCALLGIGAQIAVSELSPSLSDLLGGALVLGGIGLGFVAIYLANRESWWAIIPAGVLLTLAVVSSLEEASGMETGGVFFLGLGLTFALVALLPTQQGSLKWAWIPAGILLLMGVFFLASVEQWINYLWPVALILVGGYLALRAFLPRNK